jgi:hypothetical protein
VAQLVYDIETTTPPSSAPSQPNSVREYAGTAPGWSVPGREPDEVARRLRRSGISRPNSLRGGGSPLTTPSH